MQEKFWAKTGNSKPVNGVPQYHPVICHLADTAAVAMEIMRTYLSQSAINSLEKGLGLQGEALIRCCGFLAGCHDLGKVSPAFQFQVSEVGKALAGQHLYDLWLKMPDIYTPHGLVTAKTMPEFLLDAGLGNNLTPEQAMQLAERLAIIVGGHHGFFPSQADINDLNDALSGIGEANEWQLQRFSQRIFQQLQDYVQLTVNDFPRQCDNAAAMILAGLTTVSDWIASTDPNEGGCFPYANGKDFAIYQIGLDVLAKKSLQEMGWMKRSQSQPLEFSKLFPKCNPPRVLQKSAIKLAPKLVPPCLVMVEASMGEGKTEAALYLADYLQSRIPDESQPNTGGFYIGLPTQATSTAMWKRVQEFLGERYQDKNFVNLTLSHSAATLNEEYQKCRLEKQIYEDRDMKKTVKVGVSDWYITRKKSLLSPYGVGTIDQALMGIVRSKHQFVRLFGLAGRTVILDEIHAYDLYTSTLLERFLEWLAVLGSPVIALSATLPTSTRQMLLSAYARGCGYENVELPVSKYPRITTFSAGEPKAYHFQASQHVCRSLNIKWVSNNDEEWQLALKKILVDGGCVAIICSTVGRAQKIFEQLISYFIPEDELGLFHGRFLIKDREIIERKCLDIFGKDSKNRPRKYVLVATQVIEQSLDVDFDLMISDIAPVDLILQRSGRLHRHEERNEGRPISLKKPTIWLIQPAIDKQDKTDFQASGFIYNRHILLRTWLTLRDKRFVNLPEEMDNLVESVYDLNSDLPMNLTPVEQDDWQSSLADYKTGETRAKITQANAIKLPKASSIKDPDVFTSLKLEDNDQVIDQVTRLGEPTITTIFLQQTDQGLVLAGTNQKILLNRKPDLETTKQLLANSTRIGKQGLVQKLITEAKVPWKSALLRHCCYVILDSDGKVVVSKWLLQLDRQRGVLITKN